LELELCDYVGVIFYASEANVRDCELMLFENFKDFSLKEFAILVIFEHDKHSNKL